MSNAKEIGKKAESYVSGLAVYNDMVCTPPKEDENGWDFLLEFTTKNLGFTQEQKIKTFIQVKGFKCNFEDYEGIDFKLSNIKNMINDNHPWFIIFVCIKDKKSYLLHFDENLIKEGFEKIKKANKSGKKLHKTKWRINPNKYKTSFIEKDSDLFKDEILSYIDNISNYGLNKNYFKSIIGFYNTTIKTKFNLNQNIVEKFELGYLKDVDIEPINNEVLFENVDGVINKNISKIKLSESSFKNVDLILKINNKKFESRMKLYYSKTGNSFRFLGLFWELVINFKTKEITLKINLYENQEPQELLEIEKELTIVEKLFSREKNHLIIKDKKEENILDFYFEERSEDVENTIKNVKYLLKISRFIQNVFKGESILNQKYNLENIVDLFLSKPIPFLYSVINKEKIMFVDNYQNYQNKKNLQLILPIDLKFLNFKYTMIFEANTMSELNEDGKIKLSILDYKIHVLDELNGKEMYQECNELKETSFYNIFFSYAMIEKEKASDFEQLLIDEKDSKINKYGV